MTYTCHPPPMAAQGGGQETLPIIAAGNVRAGMPAIQVRRRRSGDLAYHKEPLPIISPLDECLPTESSCGCVRSCGQETLPIIAAEYVRAGMPAVQVRRRSGDLAYHKETLLIIEVRVPLAAPKY